MISILNTHLAIASDKLGYGLDCQIQSWEQKPSRADATFPTITLKIGYASKSNARAYKRFLAKNSPQIVKVDYSLNEPTEEADSFQLDDGDLLRTYSFIELISEKIRALLQQEVRNRSRRQDIYDLSFILRHRPPTTEEQQRILKRLIQKAKIRHLTISSVSMANPEIRRRSELEYMTLKDEIEEPLPSFNKSYSMVQAFYEGLPWERIKPS